MHPHPPNPPLKDKEIPERLVDATYPDEEGGSTVLELQATMCAEELVDTIEATFSNDQKFALVWEILHGERFDDHDTFVLFVHRLVCELELPSRPDILELYNLQVAARYGVAAQQTEEEDAIVEIAQQISDEMCRQDELELAVDQGPGVPVLINHVETHRTSSEHPNQTNVGKTATEEHKEVEEAEENARRPLGGDAAAAEKRRLRLAAKKKEALRPTVSLTWWECEKCFVVVSVCADDLPHIGIPHCPNCIETEMKQSSYSRGIEEAKFVCVLCDDETTVPRTEIVSATAYAECDRDIPDRRVCGGALVLVALGGRPVE